MMDNQIAEGSCSPGRAARPFESPGGPAVAFSVAGRDKAELRGRLDQVIDADRGLLGVPDLRHRGAVRLRLDADAANFLELVQGLFKALAVAVGVQAGQLQLN